MVYYSLPAQNLGNFTVYKHCLLKVKYLNNLMGSMQIGDNNKGIHKIETIR